HRGMPVEGDTYARDERGIAMVRRIAGSAPILRRLDEGDAGFIDQGAVGPDLEIAAFHRLDSGIDIPGERMRQSTRDDIGATFEFERTRGPAHGHALAQYESA